MLRFLSVALLLALAIGGCKKYEEGPGFSLRSKKERLVDRWKVESVMDGTTDVTSSYEGLVWSFSDEGVFTESSITQTARSGSWQFIRENEAIKITRLDSFSNIKSYDILLLKEKAFKCQRGEAIFEFSKSGDI